jgi:hypothetical protein
MLAPERRDIWVFKIGSRFFMFRKSSLELQEEEGNLQFSWHRSSFSSRDSFVGTKVQVQYCTSFLGKSYMD